MGGSCTLRILGEGKLKYLTSGCQRGVVDYEVGTKHIKDLGRRTLTQAHARGEYTGLWRYGVLTLKQGEFVQEVEVDWINRLCPEEDFCSAAILHGLRGISLSRSAAGTITVAPGAELHAVDSSNKQRLLFLNDGKVKVSFASEEKGRCGDWIAEGWEGWDDWRTGDYTINAETPNVLTWIYVVKKGKLKSEIAMELDVNWASATFKPVEWYEE